MADVWGLAPPRQADDRQADDRAAVAGDEARRRPGRRPLPPRAALAGHKGIAWIHGSAIVVWLLVAIVVGALVAAGTSVPAAVLVVALGAAAGHGLFLITHIFLAAAARRRAAANGR
jgi:hypothetical protein